MTLPFLITYIQYTLLPESQHPQQKKDPSEPETIKKIIAVLASNPSHFSFIHYGTTQTQFFGCILK
jgi:hypothetical protein